MNTKLQDQAIDLLLEDVYTKHTEIRVVAKKLGCELELDNYRQKLIEFLHSLR